MRRKGDGTLSIDLCSGKKVSIDGGALSLSSGQSGYSDSARARFGDVW